MSDFYVLLIDLIHTMNIFNYAVKVSKTCHNFKTKSFYKIPTKFVDTVIVFVHSVNNWSSQLFYLYSCESFPTLKFYCHLLPI